MFYLFILLSVITTVNGIMYEISEGDVGVYRYQGKIQPNVLKPGWHFYVPLLSSIERVDVTYQTDEFNDITCRSSDGVDIVYKEIKVVNQLPIDKVIDVITRFKNTYDKDLIMNIIDEVIKDICAEKTLDEIFRSGITETNEAVELGLKSYQKDVNSGLLIRKVTVSNPTVDEEISKRYHDKAVNKAQQAVVEEEKVLQLLHDEKIRLHEERNAMRLKSVSEINMQQQKNEGNSRAQLRQIKAEADATEKRIAAEAEAYRMNTIAEANKVLHTEKYMQLDYNKNVLAKAQAIHWGDKLPKTALYQSTSAKNPILMEE